MYVYEDELHLNATDDQELLELLADRAKNPDYAKLFQKYRMTELGQGKAIVQEFNANDKKSFILCVMTNFMCHV